MKCPWSWVFSLKLGLRYKFDCVPSVSTGRRLVSRLNRWKTIGLERNLSKQAFDKRIRENRFRRLPEKGAFRDQKWDFCGGETQKGPSYKLKNRCLIKAIERLNDLNC